ncbi:MAG: hypothetical protein KDE27_07025 [Planctomycetes bacterium]|nr:hypothetical protein [Planctomycetota bacterium]
MQRGPASLLLLALAAGCSRPVEPRPALRALVREPITAGEGTPSLQLGRTTIGDCLTNYGVRGFAVLAGDSYGIELRYLAGQLMLTFWLDGVGHDDWPELKQAVRDPENFARARPEVWNATLAAITIRAGSTPAATYWQGPVTPSPGAGKVALFSPLAAVNEAFGDGAEIRNGGASASAKLPGLTLELRRPADAEDDDPTVVTAIHAFAAAPSSPR